MLKFQTDLNVDLRSGAPWKEDFVDNPVRRRTLTYIEPECARHLSGLADANAIEVQKCGVHTRTHYRSLAFLDTHIPPLFRFLRGENGPFLINKCQKSLWASYSLHKNVLSVNSHMGHVTRWARQAARLHDAAQSRNTLGSPGS